MFLLSWARSPAPADVAALGGGKGERWELLLPPSPPPPLQVLPQL